MTKLSLQACLKAPEMYPSLRDLLRQGEMVAGIVQGGDARWRMHNFRYGEAMVLWELRFDLSGAIRIIHGSLLGR